MNASSKPNVSRRWMLGTGLVAAMAGAGAAWWRLRPDAALGPAVQDFWRQRLMQVDGAELAMSGFRGRPLLVNFWATWCPPCVEELPMIEAFWRENAGKGVQVVALAIDQPSKVRLFLERQPLSFPVALAGMEGTAMAKSLGNQGGGLPFSVFFKPNGDIYRQKLGKLEKQELQSGLLTLN